MTTAEKIDFLYSKFVSPNPAQTSVFNSQIWTQGGDIPSTLPTFDQNGEYKNVSGDVVLKRYQYVQIEQVSGFPDAFSSETVSDVVSYENGFDRSYEYRFYTKSSNGSYIEIPFGESAYFFDHDTGVLFFPEGRSLLYNPSRLYVSFIKYVGTKGINGLSQFPGHPQYGPVGPTGPTGPTGNTGAVDQFSMRYKGSWSSSTSYSKWDIVKYDGKFFISTSSSNVYHPINGTYWQPFGIPQLSTTFDYPDQTYYLSPGFSPSGPLFNDFESMFSDVNSQSFDDVTVVVYPGIYEIQNNVVVRPGVRMNFIFYGRVNVSFRDDSLSMVFSQGSTIEFRGNDFTFENGRIAFACSNLSVVGGRLSNVVLATTNLSDTSRLMAVNTEMNSLVNYASFASLRGTNVVNTLVLDEVSVTHIDGCMIQARPITEPTQEKIEIVSVATSGSPAGFGFSSPTILVKNSRILSNGAVLKSSFAPQHGFQIGLIASSLYVSDSSTDFLDFTDPVQAFVLDTVVNTPYDETKLQIVNTNGGFQTIEANFED